MSTPPALVGAIPVHETGDPLVQLPTVLGPARARVRPALAWRLEEARRSLPLDVGLRVVAGHSSEDDELSTGGVVDLAPVTTEHRRLLVETLEEVGFVNRSTDPWRWSYGDQHWALITGAPAALFGPIR